MHPFATHFPLLRITASSGPVTLRVPDPDEMTRYAGALAAGGIDDDRSRSTLEWQPASPTLAATETLAHASAAMTAAAGPTWLIPLFVFVDGEPIGRQDLRSGDDFAHLREAVTGSVLLNTHRDHGYGTRARACVLSIAWELGVSRCLTEWRSGNAASARVSEKFGYVLNGVGWWWDPLAEREVELQRAFVTEDRFRAAWSEPVEVTGVDDDARGWLVG